MERHDPLNPHAVAEPLAPEPPKRPRKRGKEKAPPPAAPAAPPGADQPLLAALAEVKDATLSWFYAGMAKRPAPDNLRRDFTAFCQACPAFKSWGEAMGAYVVRGNATPAAPAPASAADDNAAIVKQFMAGGRSAVLPNRPATAHEPAKPEAKPASFAVGCKQRGDTTWSTNRMRYATRAEALAAGHDLAGRWMGLDTWQVIETQDAVTARWDNEKGSILLDVKGADAPVPQVAIPVVVPIVPVSAPISIPVNHTSAPAAAARVGVTPLWRRRLQSLLVLASAP